MKYLNDDSEDGDHQLFFVTSYSDFEKLGKIIMGYRYIDTNGQEELWSTLSSLISSSR